MLRSLAIGIAMIATLSLPVVVFAEDSKVDPQASSPAGAVYEIPLQTARDFGSPGGSGHAGGGSGGGGVLPKGSAIKSENGYGSSSKVPGLSATAAKKEQTQAKSAAPQATAANTNNGNASGSSAAATNATDSGATTPAAPQISTRNAASDAPSLSGTYGLVILIVLGGAAAGLVASLAARGSFGRS